MTGDWFVWGMITMNAGAMLAYAWQGHGWKAVYWASVLVLNYSLLRLK